MKTITILGEEVKIGFSMAVELAYEEMTDEAFDVGRLARQKNSLAMGMASIKTFNPETKLTMEQIAMNASYEEIKALNDTVVSEMLDWLKIPKVIKEQAQPSEEGEDNQKN